MRAERVISESAGIDTLGINCTYRNRKTDRICICIRFVLYCDGIACAKEGTLRKCEGRDAVSVLEPLEGVGRPVRPIPRCDARDCRTRVCVRRPLSLPLQANVISFDRHDGYQRKQSERGC